MIYEFNSGDMFYLFSNHVILVLNKEMISDDPGENLIKTLEMGVVNTYTQKKLQMVFEKYCELYLVTFDSLRVISNLD